jgi:5-methylthioribose kinase
MASTTIDIENPEHLLPYLRSHGWLAGESKPDIKLLTGGVSNRAIYIDDGERAMVLKQALEKLRVKVDWFSPVERIHREAQGLRWLQQIEPAGSVPGFIFEDFEQHILAMTAVKHPHQNWKNELMEGRIDKDLFIQCGGLLGQIYRLSQKQKKKIPAPFFDTGYFESLRLEPYYAYSARHVPEAAAFLADLAREALTQKESIVHGDFSPKNFLIYQGRLCLLDHEVIHWGDPAFDIGFLMAHFLSKAHHLPKYREGFIQNSLFFVDAFRDEAAPSTTAWEERAVRHALGCLLARVAGRSQLEYLDPTEKQRQQEAVCLLIKQPGRSLVQLVEDFVSNIS